MIDYNTLKINYLSECIKVNFKTEKELIDIWNQMSLDTHNTLYVYNMYELNHTVCKWKATDIINSVTTHNNFNLNDKYFVFSVPENKIISFNSIYDYDKFNFESLTNYLTARNDKMLFEYESKLIHIISNNCINYDKAKSITELLIKYKLFNIIKNDWNILIPYINDNIKI
jgi:hypothetical protein